MLLGSVGPSVFGQCPTFLEGTVPSMHLEVLAPCRPLYFWLARFCDFGVLGAPHFWMARCAPFLVQCPVPPLLLEGPAPLFVLLVGTRCGPNSPRLSQGPATSLFGGPCDIHGFEGPNSRHPPCSWGTSTSCAFGGPGALNFWRTHRPPCFCGAVF